MVKITLPNELVEKLKQKYPNTTLEEIVANIILERTSPQSKPQSV